MSRVIFKFDPEKEYEYINFFEENFAKVDLPEHVRKIWNNKEQAIKLIAAEYDEKKKENYEKRWKKIEKDYFDLVEKITGHKWNHETYTVIVTKYMSGFCNPLDANTGEVMVCQDFDDLENTYIIAHELFHSHYYKISSMKNKPKLLETELNENCVILTLCFTEIKNLLVEPKNDWIIKGWVSSHPKAEKYFKGLLAIWQNKLSFDDYLDKSLKFLKTAEL